MQAFFDLFANIMAFFYSVVPNYAVAIIALTLLVMIVVTPLTLKGTRSMMVMQQLQPEMRKIQTKYKDDRQKLNEELLKFYKENNINPLGGCLPLLVQAPIFIVLYQVLRGLTRREPSLGYFSGWSTGQFGLGNGPSQAPEIVRVFDPAYLNQSTDMYQNLHQSTEMWAFGMDLSQSASNELNNGIVQALPYLALIVVVAVTGFVQQRQIQGRNTGAAINPQQQMIMKILPIFLPVISFGLPAGLVLYFAVSNLYRIGQQAFISRSIYGMSRAEQKANRQALAEAAKGGKDGKAGKGGATGTKDAPAKRLTPKGASDAEETETAEGKGAARRAGKGASGKAGTEDDGGKGARAPAATGQQKGGGAKRTQGGGRGKSGSASTRSTTGDRSGDAPARPALQPRARKPKKR